MLQSCQLLLVQARLKLIDCAGLVCCQLLEALPAVVVIPTGGLLLGQALHQPLQLIL